MMTDITDLKNRLEKNLRVLGKWAQQQGIECYRLYDADLPEFAFAVDLYGERVHIAEYQAPAKIDPAKVEARREGMLLALQEVLNVPARVLTIKSRERQRGSKQYEVEDNQGKFFSVREGRAKLYVNLTDYLDTGLFLDHRAIRRFIFERARGKRFLNLFCYTGTASVHAALGGATSSLSIDMSNTYLEWARRNYQENKVGGKRHRLKRADCVAFLETLVDRRPPSLDASDKDAEKGLFDLIFLDPPTFSNSKKTDNVLDIQRDHAKLITGCMARLASGGLLIFSNNCRGFKLDAEIALRYRVKDFSRQSLDRDFHRNPKIHQTWLIEP